MAMQGPDFLTKRQMREQIALPKVGVHYADGSGGVKDFSVGDASELGSLDAAFGAAAAGVRRKQNLGLADSLNKSKGEVKLRTNQKSGIVLDGDQIMLRGEESGKHLRSGRFFGTDEHDKPGWNDINDIDKPVKGVIVGKTLNTEASADSAEKNIERCDYAWSYETSRTAFKKDDESGKISLYNYFRTVYVSKIGRTIGCSDEREVLVGEFDGRGGGDYCAKPIVDGSGNVTGIAFGTSAELKKGTPSKTVAISGGKFGVKAEYADGVLSALKFGTDDQLSGGSFSSKVNTYLGCPYQGS